MANAPVSAFPFALEQFTTLLAGCQWPLYTFLRGIVGDDEQARDLMQDTFYDAWRAAQRGMPPFHAGDERDVGIRRWLFHVAYNRACSALRRRLISWLPLESFSFITSEGASFENQVAESQAVRAAMASLAPADASCLLLIAVHGFTAAEVSEIIGGSPQSVAKRFSRAKQRLRTIYLAQNMEEARR